jgi:hypothetical protein
MPEPVPITPREHNLAELRAFLFNVVRLERTVDALLRERETKTP